MSLEKSLENQKTDLESLTLFLQNVFDIIIEEAVDMKKSASKTDSDFENGCVYAYYRVLELIKQHLETSYNIPPSIFGLDKFDHDILLPGKKLL